MRSISKANHAIKKCNYMIYKKMKSAMLRFLLFSKAKPVRSFFLGYLILAISIVTPLFIAVVLNYLFLNSMGVSNGTKTVITIIIFLPFAPIFYFMFFITIEIYLNFFFVGWIIGLKERPILNWFTSWFFRLEKADV